MSESAAPSRDAPLPGETADTPDRPKVKVSWSQIGAVATRPGFVVGHLVVLLLAATTIFLGHWQWVAAHVHHGSLQNYAYAFQWWIFCGFGLLMWLRIMRDKVAREIEQDQSLPTAAERRREQERARATAPVGYRPYVAPVVGGGPGDDDDDPLRARYNAELARYRREA